VNNGTVSFVGAGTATITVTTQDGGKTATCAVTVQAAAIPVTSVTLNKTTLSKMVGDAAETLTATVAPENATDKAVTWSTDNTDVVTVTDGVVNFVGAGTATITVTTQDGGKTATCAVTVQALPPVPVFDGLEEEYFVGSPAVTLKVKGVGSEKLTVFKVNGQDVTAFNPVAKGTYKVEAVSPDGKLKIYRIIIVK
jgi:uncharacterized protein YjdB